MADSTSLFPDLMKRQQQFYRDAILKALARGQQPGVPVPPPVTGLPARPTTPGPGLPDPSTLLGGANHIPAPGSVRRTPAQNRPTPPPPPSGLPGAGLPDPSTLHGGANAGQGPRRAPAAAAPGGLPAVTPSPTPPLPPVTTAPPPSLPPTPQGGPPIQIPPTAPPATPSGSGTLLTEGLSGLGPHQNFTGFNLQREQNPGLDSKDAFANAVSHAPPPTDTSQAGLQAWLETHVVPGMRAHGFEVTKVDGDKIHVNTNDGPQIVDVYSQTQGGKFAWRVEWPPGHPSTGGTENFSPTGPESGPDGETGGGGTFTDSGDSRTELTGFRPEVNTNNQQFFDLLLQQLLAAIQRGS